MVVRNSPEERVRFYPIMGINRFDVADWMIGSFRDLTSEDEIINNLTSTQMEAIANTMAEYFCETDAYNEAMAFALEKVLNKKVGQ